jgi:DUF1707 SHOCT-like domain/Cell wall-active antibiotics response LiaF, C-terminal
VTELPEVRASDAEREAAAVRLRDAAAEGRLTFEELTDRLDRTYAARTRSELEEVTRDLPDASVAVAATPEKPTRRRTGTRWVVSLMGNTARRGRWHVGEQTNAITVMGNCTIDLREAILGGPDVRIAVLCAMGNVHLIVPDGVDVDLGVIALLGNKIDHRRGAPHPEAPVVRVEGLVLMGNLTVRSSGGGSRLPLPPPPPPVLD